MARDVKINWPAVGKPYRGFISKFRQCLDEVYDFGLHSPKAKPLIREQFEAFATAAGVAATPLPGDQVVVSDGDTLAEAGGGTIAVTVVDGVATYTYTAGGG